MSKLQVIFLRPQKVRSSGMSHLSLQADIMKINHLFPQNTSWGHFYSVGLVAILGPNGYCCDFRCELTSPKAEGSHLIWVTLTNLPLLPGKVFCHFNNSNLTRVGCYLKRTSKSPELHQCDSSGRKYQRKGRMLN